jgi:hypothetical protein
LLSARESKSLTDQLGDVTNAAQLKKFLELGIQFQIKRVQAGIQEDIDRASNGLVKTALDLMYQEAVRTSLIAEWDALLQKM